MRNVTSQIVEAFGARRAARISNSSTDGQALFLHGNKIAEWRDNGLWVTTAGWNTVTTRERLNGLPGVRVTARGVLRLNGKVWDGSWACVAPGQPFSA